MIKRLKSWFLPSIADVFFISILFYLLLSSDKGDLLGDGDTGYHVRAGEYILNTLTIPRTDIFSFITPVLPWTAHEWLSEVVMALLHKMGGLTAVVIAFAFMIAVTVRIFYRNVLSEGHNILLSVTACIMFLALSKVHWLARPHIFSLLILLVWYRLLDDFQYRRQNRLWTLPCIMVLWVNLHGGYIIGLTILGVYFAGNYLPRFVDKGVWENSGRDNSKRLGLILGASLIACLANPIGYKIFLFPFHLISETYIMDHTNEFMSPNFHEVQPFKYLLFLLIIFFAYSKRKPGLIEILLTLLFTGMSLTSVRYIPLFAVIVIPILLRHIDRDSLAAFPGVQGFFRQRLENITAVDTMAKGFLWPLSGIIFLFFLVSNGTVSFALDPEKKPVAALHFLKNNPVAGNMFNNDEFGDWVIYSLYPQYKVFIDGRLDMYGSKGLKEYSRVTGFEPGWEDILAKYNITWIFFDTNSAIARFLVIHNDWKLIYSDKVASIFVKNIPMYRQLIDKFPQVKLHNNPGAMNGS